MKTEEELAEAVVIRQLGAQVGTPSLDGSKLNRRQGTVTAITTGPPPTLTVTIGDTDVPGIPYRGWYLPTVGDEVDIDFDNQSPVVLGINAPVVGGPDYALGIMATPQGSPTANSAIAAGFGTTETLWLATTAIQTYVGRRYAIKGKLRIGTAVAVTVELRVRRGNGTGGTIVGLIDVTTIAGNIKVDWDEDDVPGASASQQWSLTYRTTAGTADLLNPSKLRVEDIGIG